MGTGTRRIGGPPQGYHWRSHRCCNVHQSCIRPHSNFRLGDDTDRLPERGASDQVDDASTTRNLDFPCEGYILFTAEQNNAETVAFLYKFRTGCDLRWEPALTLPSAPYEKCRKASEDSFKTTINTNLLLFRQQKLPLYRLWNYTEVLSKFEVMVEFRYAVPYSWNMAVIENPVEFLGITPVKTQTVARPTPAADDAAF